MIELLLALTDEPAAVVQTAWGPLDVQVGAIHVGGGAMMAWNSSRDGLGGQVSVTVINRGTEPDRVVSISTPAGPVGSIKLYAMRVGATRPCPTATPRSARATPMSWPS